MQPWLKIKAYRLSKIKAKFGVNEKTIKMGEVLPPSFFTTMKAIIKYNLDDPDDRMAHLRAVKGADMALAMWTFAASLRTIIDTSEDGKWIDESDVWKAWTDAMEEYGIKIDELIV